MSKVTHTTVPVSNQSQTHRVVAVSALLALLATAAVVLVLALDGGSTDAGGAVAQSGPALRSDGAPEESAIAASISRSSKPATAGRPDESGIAAAIGGAEH